MKTMDGAFLDDAMEYLVVRAPPVGLLATAKHTADRWWVHLWFNPTFLDMTMPFHFRGREDVVQSEVMQMIQEKTFPLPGDLLVMSTIVAVFLSCVRLLILNPFVFIPLAKLLDKAILKAKRAHAKDPTIMTEAKVLRIEHTRVRKFIVCTCAMPGNLWSFQYLD